MTDTIKIVIPEFVTHAPLSKSKYIKLNGQSIYNSNLNRFSRNNVVQFLHDYLLKHIPKVTITDYPIQIALDYYVPRNYGSVSRRKKDGIYQILWKNPTDHYKINWDVGNYGYLWLKTFLDSLQLAGVIPDDNASYVKAEGPVTFKEVETFKERRLEFIISKLNV